MCNRTNLRNWLVIIASLLAIQYSVGPPAWAGSVVGWGKMYVDSSDLTEGNLVGIAAGGFHSLALKADGSITGWGLNRSRQAKLPWSSSAAQRFRKYLLTWKHLPRPNYL